MDRREFLNTAVAGAGLALLPGAVLPGASSPEGKLHVALIGYTNISGHRNTATTCVAWNDLVRRGFLVQVPDSKRYALGSSIWRLAALFRFENVLLQVARPYVDALADDTGETTHVAIREGTQALLLERQLTANVLGVAGAGSGTAMPLYCTSVGKALIADFDYDRLVQLFGGERLPRFTKRTITSVADLAEACKHARACGFAVDDEEEHEGVRCIGAPIRDASGEVVAAVGISAPVVRLPHDSIKKMGARVASAAKAISRELGRAE